MEKIKEDLLSIYHAALKAVSGKQVVAKEFSQKQYSNKKYHIIAIGKAADAMVQGLPNDSILDGLLISKHGHISDQLQQDKRFLCIESDHPIPKQVSLTAGKVLLDYIETLPQDEACLFLISGGASALIEVLNNEWSLDDLTQLTDYLLANAYPIDQINAVRKKTSKIKGGGLWNYLGTRPVTCLMISDVPNDNPEDIGSGLLFPTTNHILPSLSDQWLSRIKSAKKIKNPENFKWKIIASLSSAKQAAKHHAALLGYSVKVIPEFLDGKAIDVAEECLNLTHDNPLTFFIWGGETTVHLPKNLGKGGRNQHLALAAAIHMDERQNLNSFKNCYLLSAGTDGTDGLSTATGAIVDCHSLERGRALNLNAIDFLKKADSNSYFKATNELIVTGATGTNVMDLIFAIKTR